MLCGNTDRYQAIVNEDRSAGPLIEVLKTALLTSVFDPGCVKTRLGEGCAELFSKMPSSERSCQYNRLQHRRTRDESSTRQLDVGVFTQPGPDPDMPRSASAERGILLAVRLLIVIPP